MTYLEPPMWWPQDLTYSFQPTFITLTLWADVEDARKPIVISKDSIVWAYPGTRGDDSITVLRIDGHNMEVCEQFEGIVERLGGRL
jgi:hypothetical protein